MHVRFVRTVRRLWQLVAQKSSKRPLSWQQRRAMMALAPATGPAHAGALQPCADDLLAAGLDHAPPPRGPARSRSRPAAGPRSARRWPRSTPATGAGTAELFERGDRFLGHGRTPPVNSRSTEVVGRFRPALHPRWRSPHKSDVHPRGSGTLRRMKPVRRQVAARGASRSVRWNTEKLPERFPAGSTCSAIARAASVFLSPVEQLDVHQRVRPRVGRAGAPRFTSGSPIPNCPSIHRSPSVAPSSRNSSIPSTSDTLRTCV